MPEHYWIFINIYFKTYTHGQVKPLDLGIAQKGALPIFTFI